MFNPKTVILLLYVFAFIMLFTQVPINEYTLPYVVVLAVVFVAGLALILGWHYIIPSIKRSWRIGSCKVVDKKYVICSRKGSAELTGQVFLKVIPDQPIPDMPKERKESLLQAIQGILSGTHFEPGIIYIGMRDRYHENIVKRLQREMERIKALASYGRETLSIRDTLQRLEQELKILRQVPTILEGFYIAFVRDYDTDEYELKRKLEANARALAARLEGLGLTVKILEGEELRAILDYLLFGSVAQLTI